MQCERGLIKAGISVCLSVCIFIMSRTVHPVDFTCGGCVAADPRECSVALWCNMDTFRINTLLINYRTAQAISGAPHVGRA